MTRVLTCMSATCCFKPHTHSLHDCLSLSDCSRTAGDFEGLHLREFLRSCQESGEYAVRRINLLSGRLLQQRQRQQHQPAAPGGTVHPADHFVLRAKDPFFLKKRISSMQGLLNVSTNKQSCKVDFHFKFCFSFPFSFHVKNSLHDSCRALSAAYSINFLERNHFNALILQMSVKQIQCLNRVNKITFSNAYICVIRYYNFPLIL